MNSQRILVSVDAETTVLPNAVKRGALLARKLETGLDLLTCHYDPLLLNSHFIDPIDLEGFRKNVIHKLRLNLEEIAEPLRDQGIDVRVTAVWDTPPDEAIIRHVLRTNPKLLIRDTHYHSKLSRSLFTHTDWALVRNCPVPLWLAKSNEWPQDAKILAAVDPLHEHDKPAALDDYILDTASMLSKAMSNDLHVFHSYMTIANYPISRDVSVYPVHEVNENIKKGHRDALSNLLEGYTVAAGGVHLDSGKPEELLPKLAHDIHAGVAVMGSIARGPIKRTLIGSTIERVLDRIPCDVLVVKTLDFLTSVEPQDVELYEGELGAAGTE